MSKTKGGGSTRNGRDSNAQRLGVKVVRRHAGARRHDHRAPAGHQVPPRRATSARGGDDTLFATADGPGEVRPRAAGRKLVDVLPDSSRVV